MSRCFTLEVDGMPVRVRASGLLTKRDVEALQEIARAARRRMLAEHDLPPEVIAAETWYTQALERSRT